MLDRMQISGRAAVVKKKMPAYLAVTKGDKRRIVGAEVRMTLRETPAGKIGVAQ